jgi:hypothetical protein
LRLSTLVHIQGQKAQKALASRYDRGSDCTPERTSDSGKSCADRDHVELVEDISKHLEMEKKG